MVIKTLPIPSSKPPLIRQAGSSKSFSHSQSISCPPLHRSSPSESHHLPDAAQLRQMCIITKSDLGRIYDSLERRQREKDAIRQEIERKKDLAERSAQLTKSWTNTIIGARERKLELKKIREQEDEERKKLIDIEEEKLAAERRREHIEKAKQQQYYETDRIRTFHSALMLSEVLKERDMQIEMKKRIEQMRQTDENEDRQRFQDEQAEFYKSEQEKIQKKMKDHADLSKYHLAQMQQRKAQLLEEKRKDQREGGEYQRLAQQYALEQTETERFRKLNQKEVKSMYDQALEEKRKIKQIEQELDEEEDEQLRVYAEAKKKIARLRREKELEVHREKQQARDHMIGYLGSLQKRAEADYETQIFRARAQQEAKQRREEEEKFAKEQKMQESIRKHRYETIKRREVEREIEERDDLAMRQKKAEADQLYQMYQEEKEKQRLEDAQANAQSHLKQIQERKERQRAMKATEYDEVQMEKHLSEVERQQYRDYTNRVINFMEENGRNTYPMKRVVVEEMKRFDQVNQNPTKESSPTSTGDQAHGQHDSSNLDETKKHLGFQWNQPPKPK